MATLLARRQGGIRVELNEASGRRIRKVNMSYMIPSEIAFLSAKYELAENS